MNSKEEYTNEIETIEEISDIMAVLKKIQEQLGFLEKKVDILLQQSPSGAKPFRNFKSQRPFQPRHQGHRHSHQNRFREGGFRQQQDRPFMHGNEQNHDRDRQHEGFGRRKKEFFRGRKGR